MTDRSRISILYVDDEEINLLLFERSFGEKYHIHSATSGAEGLEILDAIPEIDVVISDMRMHEMDGIEFISHAKQHHPEKIYYILTGFRFGDEIEEALQKQLINNSFSKPFDREMIEEAIAEALG